MVTALVGVKRVAKLAKDMEEGLKTAVKHRAQPRKDGAVLNEKVVLEGEGGAKIELRPKGTTTFDAPAAARVLREKGLYDEACEKTTVVTDPQALFTTLKQVQETLLRLGQNDLAIDIGVALKTAVEERATLSEDRILDLVKAEKLDMAAVQAFYSTTFDHAVYEGK
jgi:hypothetical protein